jgi:hypothetical protein
MRPRTGIAAFVTVLSAAGVLAAATAAGASTARPSPEDHLIPGDLLVSESYYTNDPGIVAGQTVLPPGCTSGCATAVANGNYPYVFNNDSVDGSFGVTSRLFLREITPFGRTEDVLPVPSSELNTSFSSKSEGALNLSSDGKYVTFIDYVAPSDTVDVSNANTPGVIDSTNPSPARTRRGRAAVGGREVLVHRDQRLQRQQRAGRGRGQDQRQVLHLHRRERGQRQRDAAGRGHPGRGRADHDPVRPA